MGERRHFGLGALILAVLCLAQPAGARAAALTSAEAEEFEQLLAELSFDPGPIDGVIDGRTRTAIELYQAFAALPVDGEPDPALLAELRQVARAFAEINAAKAAGEAAPAAPAGAPDTGPSEAVADTAPEPVPEPVAEPEPGPESPVQAAPEPQPAAPAEPEVAAPAEAVPEPEPKPKALAGAVPKPDPEPKPEAAAKAAPEPEPQSEAAAETAPEPEPKPEAAAKAAPAPAPAAAAETAPPAAAQPKAGFDLDNMIARLVNRDAAAGAPAQAGPDRDLVRAVQRQLVRIGLDPGPLDGRAGVRTVQAIQAYQDARDLPVDGRPSRDLLERLAREPDGAATTGQSSRIATDGTMAQVLGAAGGDKFPAQAPGAGADATAAAERVRDGYDAFRKAFSAAETGDFARAIELYTRAIESGDLALAELADAFYNRANARSYTKAFDFAIADYSAAIVNKPRFPGAYYNRGFAYEASGRRTRALADYMKARALGLQRLGVRSPDRPPPGR